MKISKADTASAVYKSMRNLGEDALIRKEWAAAAAYGCAALRLAQEMRNEAERTVQDESGQD